VLAAGFGEDRQRAGDKPMERRFEAVRVAEQSLQGLQIPGGGAHTPDRRQISEHVLEAQARCQVLELHDRGNSQL